MPLFYRVTFFLMLFMLAACGAPQQAERVTLVPTQVGAGAPVYTATPTFTPSPTSTATATNTATATATATFTPSDTPTATYTPTATATPTNTPTSTPSPTATVALQTLTPVPNRSGRSQPIGAASFLEASGWSCGDFPCEDDIDGWLRRIQVPSGFSVSHVGRFDGQVMQITVGAHDGRTYATVLENGTLDGAVYVMNADGTTERYSDTLHLPIGLAFQPGTDVLYVTSRIASDDGAALWRIESDGDMQAVIDDLPCCYQEVGNQPNGLLFGQDGYLYMGIGALTDHTEGRDPSQRAFDPLHPLEAAVLRINPHTGDVTRFADGLHNPFDLAQTSNGQFYATDQGLVEGMGDRILSISEGANYGWPYYRLRGCGDCPPTRGALDIAPDLLSLLDYTLPHGLVTYQGDSFPVVMHDTLLVAFWNGTDWAQRIVWIDPNDPALSSEDYVPQAFVTGLVRPIDLAVAPDGSVLVADYIYGQIWRISYGDGSPIGVSTSQFSFETPTVQATSGSRNTFVTSTPSN